MNPLSPRMAPALIGVACLVVYSLSLGHGALATDWQLVAAGPDAGKVPRLLFGVVAGLVHHDLAARLAAVVLHGVAALLVWAVAGRLADERTALGAALLFAVWPAGSQAVLSLADLAWLVGTIACLSVLWIAGSPAPDRYRMTLSAAITALALHLTAQAAALPVLLLGLDRMQRQRAEAEDDGPGSGPISGPISRPINLGTHLGVYGVVLAWALWHLPRLSGTIALIDPVDNPMVLLPAWERVIVALDGLWTAARISLLPAHLSADHGMGAYDGAASILTGLRAIVIVALATWLVTRIRQNAEPIALGAGWWLVAMLPVASLVVPASHALSEAALYLPAAGVCLAVAGAVSLIDDRTGRRRYAMLAVGGVLLVMMAGRTMGRSLDWRSDDALWRATLASQPGSARAHERLATALRARGADDTAARHYERALAIDPTYVTAHYNLGLLLYDQRKWAQALARFETVCEIDPHHTAGQLNRGAALFRLQRWMEAADAYRQAADLKPAWPVPWLNLADALRAAGELDAAAAAADHARSLGGVTVDR